jgi:hypothetical protein
VWRSHFALADSSSFVIQYSARSHTIIRRPVENPINAKKFIQQAFSASQNFLGGKTPKGIYWAFCLRLC